MTIGFLNIGKVKITMYDYVDEMISELPTEMIGKSVTPASNHLFEIRDNDDISKDGVLINHWDINFDFSKLMRMIALAVIWFSCT